MNNWSAPQRPNTYAEHALLDAILDGTFEPGSTLPGERTLAVELGVTRPTLREAIQRLSRDGWLTVRQGKPTVVNDYWRDGGLNVLNTLVNHNDHLPMGFVNNLLEVRLQLAPAYTFAAVSREPQATAGVLADHETLQNDPASYAAFDWRLHRQLTLISGNPIYTLILNGFGDFYERLAQIYFIPAESRARSLDFYSQLADAAANGDAGQAQEISRAAMIESLEIWQRLKTDLGSDGDQHGR